MRERRHRQLTEERRPRGPVAGDAPPLVQVRARAGRFELRDGEAWTPLFVKGVNLGTALPGNYPVEFPDDPALYREWFDLIGEMGANAVRLYTLHPPSLYRALREHNAERPGSAGAGANKGISASGRDCDTIARVPHQGVEAPCREVGAGVGTDRHIVASGEAGVALKTE